MSKKLKVPEPQVDAPHDPFAEGIRRRTEARDRARAEKAQHRRELLNELNNRGAR